MIATPTNFLPLSGGTMSGNIKFSGSTGGVAGELLDNAGNPVFAILEGGTGSPGGLQLAANCSLCFDPTQASSITGDGNANLAIQASSATVTMGGSSASGSSSANYSTSGVISVAGLSSGQVARGSQSAGTATVSSGAGTAIGAELLGVAAAAGSANTYGFALTGSVTGSTTGKRALGGVFSKSGANYALRGSFDTNGNYTVATFSAAQMIFVDGVNGGDATGIGTEASPYKTIAQACSVATAGQCIFVKPGIYTLAGANSGVTPPNGVAIVGSGRGVTVIQNHTDYNAVYRPGSNCLLRDLTLDTADPTGTHNGISVHFATSGVTPSNVTFENVDFICSYDGVNPGGNGIPGGGPGPFYWYFLNCRWHGACWMYYDQANINAYFLNCNWLGDGTIPRLDGNPQYAAVAAANSTSRVTVVGGNINFVDPTTNANLMANAAVLAGPANILFS